MRKVVYGVRDGGKREYLYNWECQNPPYQYLLAGIIIQMGKRNKSNNREPPQPVDIRAYPIAKNKTFQHNLNAFINMLEKQHPQLTSRQFLTEVHAFVERVRQKTKGKKVAVEMARQKIRICRHCDGWSGKQLMLQCEICEDFYHFSCKGQERLSLKETGLCINCENNKLQKFDRSSYLSALLDDQCFKCNKDRQEKEAFVHCLRCSNRFHKKCYGNTVAVCSNCKLQIDDELKKKSKIRQSLLPEFYSSQKKVASAGKEEEATKTVAVCRDKRVENEGKDEEKTVAFTSKELFNCRCSSELSEKEIEEYQQDLMFAILAKNMNYTEKLKPINCSLDNNTEESLDFGLDHMTWVELKVYTAYKKQPIGPFKFVFTEGMGYDVVADRDIKEKALICQYIGQVVTLRECIDLETKHKNDSLMELRAGCNADETLIIRPDKYANMARFINGINNSKPKSKPNVGTVRKLARGLPTVILYSLRGIKKGESLLYDYNAGSSTCQYDTSNFL